MSNFRDGMIGPSVILFTICLVITVALAATYQVTLPIIEAAELAAAEEARAEVLPAAGSFTQITDANLPDAIQEAYVADNGAGYVFKAGAKGFDGLVTFMVGMDADGAYVGINMFDHNETPGLGSKIGAADYLAQYKDLTEPDAVDSITGATKTSNALKNTLRACSEAYEQLSK